MPYSVAAIRGKNFGSSDVPWYLSGGISSSVCLGAYRAKGAGSLAASYVNLCNPGTNDLTLGVAPSWADNTGWTFDGATQFLKTGITPGVIGSLIVKISGTATNDRFILGSTGGATSYFALENDAPGNKLYYEHQNFLGVAPKIASGDVAGFSGQQGYRNGLADGGAIGTGGGTYKEIYIGCVNNNGAAQGFWDKSIIAVAFYSSNITADQMALLTTAINVF